MSSPRGRTRLQARASRTVKWLIGSVARWKGVVGLNYHRIGDGQRSIFDRGLWSATEEEFDRQVGWLAKNFELVSPLDIPDIVARRKPGRHVLISFDDGYADNYLSAFPILKAHRAPCAFFVATGYLDQPRLPWWDEIAWMVRKSNRKRLEVPGFLDAPIDVDDPDRERAVNALLKSYKRLPIGRTAAYLDAIAEATGTGRATADVVDAQALWMTWDMVREMHAGGMTIGGHTVNHPILSSMSREEQAKEIDTCGSRIEAEIGAKMKAFAYPVGARWAFNDDTRSVLKERGVETAYSYYEGFRRLDQWDNYDIRRIAIEQEHSFPDFRAKVMFPWRS